MTARPIGDLLQRYAAEKDPDAPALIYPRATVTWRGLDEQANRRARLYRSLGVGRDDLVVLALENGPAFHEAAFAIWKLGATPTILSPRLSAQEFEAIVSLATPKLVIGGRPEVCTCPAISGDHDVFGFDDGAIESSVATYWKAVASGGSTGRPKIIVDHMPGEFDPAAPGLHTLIRMPAGGVMLNPGPLHHNGPFLFTSLALFTGTTVIGMERFDAEEALRLIERYRVNWVCLVPTMMHRIWSLPPAVRDRYDLSSLRTVWHMAAPCAPWLKRAWIDWLGAERIWEAYAGTERFGVTVIRGDEWLKRPGSVGRVIGGGRVKAVREDGSDCNPGEVGELFFLPPNGAIPSHYLGAEPRRAGAGWCSIGDLGYVDAEGFVYLADRRTDLILRGGANIYPAEIEAALEEHPSVASAVAIGLPCAEMGARVHAVIQVKGARPSVSELLEFLAPRLTRYKLPESFEFVDQALRDDAGKVRRSALRDERVRWLEEGREFRDSSSPSVLRNKARDA